MMELLLAAAVATAGPGVRNAHGMFFDGQRVVVFGGADAAGVKADTWGWNGRRWTRLADEGPVARTFPAVAADPEGRRAFLFGGSRVLFGEGPRLDSLLDDFWAWDGAAWSRLPGAEPGARAEAALAYDDCRKRLVLYGGYRYEADRLVPLGDTWEWDGQAWRAASVSGPGARHGAALAFDGARCRTLLYGGNGANGETWEWDGLAWKRLVTPPGPGRYNAAMTYVGDRRRVLRFGGWDGQGRVSDTWSFRDDRWEALTGAAPPPRNHAALAYDPIRHRAVLFGGHDGAFVYGDVWELVADRWRLVYDRAAERRLDNGH